MAQIEETLERARAALVGNGVEPSQHFAESGKMLESVTRHDAGLQIISSREPPAISSQ